jgi:hypothetical protein
VVAADIDYGPYLLALTPHAVVSAPYHRLSAGILAGHEVFAAPPDEAQRVVARLGVTYVISCGARAPKDVVRTSLDTSLWAKLRAGDPPSWLAPVALSDSAFVAYRVVPQ